MSAATTTTHAVASTSRPRRDSARKHSHDAADRHSSSNSNARPRRAQRVDWSHLNKADEDDDDWILYDNAAPAPAQDDDSNEDSEQDELDSDESDSSADFEEDEKPTQRKKPSAPSSLSSVTSSSSSSVPPARQPSRLVSQPSSGPSPLPTSRPGISTARSTESPPRKRQRIDLSLLPPRDAVREKVRRAPTRDGRTFLETIHALLEHGTARQRQHIHWDNSGLYVVVPDLEAFLHVIAAENFKFSKVESFNKQMHNWGYTYRRELMKPLLAQRASKGKIWQHDSLRRGSTDDDVSRVRRRPDSNARSFKIQERLRREALLTSAPSASSASPAPGPPPKRGRGRPRKHPLPVKADLDSDVYHTASSDEEVALALTGVSPRKVAPPPPPPPPQRFFIEDDDQPRARTLAERRRTASASPRKKHSARTVLADPPEPPPEPLYAPRHTPLFMRKDAVEIAPALGTGSLASVARAAPAPHVSPARPVLRVAPAAQHQPVRVTHSKSLYTYHAPASPWQAPHTAYEPNEDDDDYEDAISSCSAPASCPAQAPRDRRTREGSLPAY